jgi:pilus assembly protein CpaF
VKSSEPTVILEILTQERLFAEHSFSLGTQIWLGRDPSCNVPLPDPSVSRRHCRIDSDQRGMHVSDASANGTIVAGQLVKRTTLSVRGATTMRVGPYDVRARLVGLQLPEAAASGELSHLSAGASAAVDVALRKRIHRALLEHLDLASLDRQKMNAVAMRPKVVAALRRITEDLSAELEPGPVREQLITELCNEALGLGPLEELLADDSISEIMVVDPSTIFFERSGTLHRSGLRFTDDDAVRAVIERIVTPLGRRIDESTPLVDARLADGSRVNAIIPPLALRGASITIRKFAKRRLGMQDLIGFGAMTQQMGRFLERSVKVRKNILISGGTGSGKTTLLNVLSEAIPDGERIVTIEDAAELKLSQSHVVSLESRPANMEGKGAYTIRDLVKNSLRMRPDRIVVGECRGGEALDMLQAMNTGHEGSMTTIHANSPTEAVARCETLCLMAGFDLPVRAIRQQIASSVHLIIQQMRLSDGSRRITNISEVGDVGPEGEVEICEIFGFIRTGTDARGKILGEYRATGYMPSYLDEFITHGLISDGNFL